MPGSATSMPAARRGRTLTGRRGFRWWLGAATLSTLGDAVTFFAIGWVAAGHGPAVASLVLTLEGIPLVVLMLLGGGLADRFGIRRVMLGCDVVMAAVMAAFCLGTLRAAPVWALATVAVLAGSASAVRRPAEGVFPRLFAHGDELARTLATTTMCHQLARLAGPSVAGVLLGVGGLPLTAGLDALSFLVVVVVLAAVRPPHEPAPAGRAQPLTRRLADGVATARRTPGVPATILTVAGLSATVLPLVMLCVPLVGHERGWGADGTGVVSAAWVLGGLVALTAVRRWGAPAAWLAQVGPVAAATGVLLLAATTSRAAAAVALGLVGVGSSVLTSRLVPRLLSATPPDLLARYSALVGLAQTGPVLVMTPLLGHLAGTAGPSSTLVALAVVLALTALAARRAEPGITGAASQAPGTRRPPTAPTGTPPP